MADNQEEYYKRIFRSRGVKMDEVSKALGFKNKQSYYNQIRKSQLSQGFKKKLEDYIKQLDKKSSTAHDVGIIENQEITILRQTIDQRNMEIDSLKKEVDLLREVVNLLKEKKK